MTLSILPTRTVSTEITEHKRRIARDALRWRALCILDLIAQIEAGSPEARNAEAKLKALTAQGVRYV
jgi:hypothetical protein